MKKIIKMWVISVLMLIIIGILLCIIPYLYYSPILKKLNTACKSVVNNETYTQFTENLQQKINIEKEIKIYSNEKEEGYTYVYIVKSPFTTYIDLPSGCHIQTDKNGKILGKSSIGGYPDQDNF